MSRKRDHEKAIFRAFLDLEPEFAGERLAEWEQPEDEREFPDIRAKSVSGRRVGVELGEWLNEEEIAAAKSKESVEASILSAIGEQGANSTRHVDFVWLHPKLDVRVKSSEAAAFRDQIFALIQDCDRRWPNERWWHSPQGAQLTGDELAAYPTIAKYINVVKLWPKRDGHGWPAGVDWILFPARVGSFDRETMFKPLRELIAEKIAHYGPNRTGFDGLSLVVFYNLAWIYNSPAETPLFTFEDAAARVRQLLSSGLGPFDRVFLFLALVPGRVLRIV
jgi:hypothetical protein